MSIKNWFLFKLGRAIAAQATTSSVEAVDAAPASADSALASAAVAKMEDLYQRILDLSLNDASLGFQREQMPCLIAVNGDLLWVPAHLLKFLWHTRMTAEPPFILHFLAETPHYNWIRERLHPGDTVIDCGANLGLFSTMMAQRVGPTGTVHAFEPSPNSCRDLTQVLRLNQLTCVVVNACAMADSCGEAVFCDITEGDVRREGSHLNALGRMDFMGGIGHQEIRVPTTTLDTYVAERDITPRLIKIDVEGAEFLVLEGGRNCLRTCKPLLVIEIHPDDRGEFDHARLREFLNEYGYSYTWEDKTYYCDRN